MKLLLSIMSLFIVNIMIAQVCIPDTTQIPDNSFIYPIPYQDTVPGSGIPNKACIGTEYSQVFHVKIPETVIFLGFTVHVEKITLNSIGGLPAGLTYECNPAGCEMLKNTTGCMLIHGTPLASNTVKKYPITLNFTFTTKEFGPQQLTFPDESIAPGIYEIDLLAQGSAGCILATNELKFNFVHTAFVNEGLDRLVLQINSKEVLSGNFEIYNMTGTLLVQNSLRINQGPNEFNIDINALKSGAYFYKIRSGKRFETGKIFIPGN